jgi:hypothetical protein
MDNVLIMQPVHELINTTINDFPLLNMFGLRETCRETGYVPMQGDLDAHTTTWVDFSFDRADGQIPNITSAGSCATPVGSFIIEKEVKRMFKDAGDTCPVWRHGAHPTRHGLR